jgi:hypothetical protein
MTGQMPVHNAGGDMEMQGWQRQHNKGKDAHVTRATMPVQRWQQRWRNAGNDASACHNCFVTGQTPVRDAGNDAKVMRVTMPEQQGQKRPLNKGNDAGATPAMTTTGRH